jgi:ribosomal protein S12 methylthiotransferase
MRKDSHDHASAGTKPLRRGNGPLRVGLISLGCAKNLVDAEIMLGALLKDGVEITNDAAQADAVIVNTCSFIDAAQEESVDTILESAEVRAAKNRGQSLIVSGCLPQRFRDELPKLLPEVDAFMGIDQVAQVPEIVRQAVARRAEKVGKHSTFNIQHSTSKGKITGRFAEMDKRCGTTEHEKAETLRGTDKFGKTKTIVATSRQSAAIPSVKLIEGNERERGRGGALLEVNPRPTFIPDFGTPRFRLTPRHFAYVKIAEGCNHPCSFCIIPRMRGSHRSRRQADIVAEAKALIAGGVKELNLISQDSTYYGLDLRPAHSGTGVPPVSFDESRQSQLFLKHTGGTPVPLRPSRAISSPEKFSATVRSLPANSTTICTLLRELNALKGDFWIRLLYTHPAHWTDELIRTIAACPKVARYVDIPLQHIHGNMLERMRRETSRQYIVDLIKRIRAGVPGIALRTTFIVGFPGETEKCFEELLDFIREMKFERLGVFAYSQEDGTRAGAMSGQIPDRVKQQRRKLAMAEQHKIARQVSESFVGREIKVLVEGRADAKQLQDANVSSWEHGLVRDRDSRRSTLGSRHFLIARGEADAPDIDGRVYICGKFPIGEFARVKIIGHTDYDLIAEPV